MKIILDTYILIFLTSLSSPFREACRKAISHHILNGDKLCVAAQNLFEFWVWATRPIQDGGKGLSPQDAFTQIETFIRDLELLSDLNVDYQKVFRLAMSKNILGVGIHDTRLAALMIENQVTHIISNDSRFDRFNPDIVRVDLSAYSGS